MFRPDARSGDIGRFAGAIEATLSQSPTGMDCSVKSNLAALSCGRWSQLVTVTLQIEQTVGFRTAADQYNCRADQRASSTPRSG